MSLLNSDALLDLLSNKKLITPEQRKFITLEKGKQRQKLLKQFGDEQKLDKSFPDLVDIIVSFKLNAGRRKGQLLDEDSIIQAVSQVCNIPFKNTLSEEGIQQDPLKALPGKKVSPPPGADYPDANPS